MKSKPIYCLPSGIKGISTAVGVIKAIRPAAKGEDSSPVLYADGTFGKLAGARINGVGVERFVVSAGYTPAADADADAARLQDLINVRVGLKLVEDALIKRRDDLQEQLAGQEVLVVPLSNKDAVHRMRVSSDTTIRTQVLGLGDGISCPVVRCLKLDPSQDGFPSFDADLLHYRLINDRIDVQSVPRYNKLANPIEHAFYVLENAGMGTLEGASFIADGANDAFPKGLLKMQLTAGGTLLVGVDAAGETQIQRLDDSGRVMKQRKGLECFNGRLVLGSVVGSIAAVLV